MKLTFKLIQEFNEEMHGMIKADVIKKNQMLEDKKKEMNRGVMAQKIRKVYETKHTSKLFCDFYKPNGEENEIYNRFGFYWPKLDDLVDLCLNNEIEPKDLILEKVLWVKNACGFEALKFEFKGGKKGAIQSPMFKCQRCDGDVFFTTVLEGGKQPKYVRLQIGENKFLEQMEFKSAKDKNAESSILKAYCCKKDTNEDEWFEVPAGHNLVGLFGFTSTNKYVDEAHWPDGVRQWDTIRGFGFITMNLNA